MIIDQLRDTDSPLRARQALPLVLTAAWALCYADTFAGLLRRWTQWDQDMSYGLPVAGIFIYLLIKTLPWHGHPVGRREFILWSGATAIGSLAWFACRLVGISIFEQLMLIPLLALALTSLFGVQAVIAHRLLLALLIFVIPVWGSLNGVLLMISSGVVGELVHLIDMPARIEGNSIFIPYGHILIADGCSGLRYFVISLLLGYLLAYLNRYTERGLLVVLMVAASIGLIANWLRIFILILIGYGTQMQSPLMADHELFGWLLFAALCLPALYFSPVVKPAPAVDAPTHESVQPAVLLGPDWGRLVAVCVALALGPLLNLLVSIQPSVRAMENYWGDTMSARSVTLPVPVTAPENSHSEAVILLGGILAQLDQYQRATADDKLVPYFSYLYPQGQWLRDNRGGVLLDEQTPSSATNSSAVVTRHSPKANLSIFQRRDSHTYVAQLQWFEVGRYTATTVLWAKLLQIPAAVTRDNHFAILTVQAHCSERSCEGSLEGLKEAARELMAARAAAR